MTDSRDRDGMGRAPQTGSAAGKAGRSAAEGLAPQQQSVAPPRQGFAPPGDDLYEHLPDLGRELLDEAVPRILLDALPRNDGNR